MKDCPRDCKCLVCVRHCMEACKDCERYKKAPVTWCENYSEKCRQITIADILGGSE